MTQYLISFDDGAMIIPEEESTCARAGRRWSGLPRSPSRASVRKRCGSSCPPARLIEGARHARARCASVAAVMASTVASRAAGALYGLALGDALGMPTQSLARQHIRTLYGDISWFHPGPSDNPLSAGMAAGSITDDTEQAVLLAEVLIEGNGRVDAVVLAQRLLAWQDGMRARGSLDLLGPSSSRAFEALMAGESVQTTGRFGTTNGAAMRITPVGIAVPGGDLAGLVDHVVDASAVSHNTSVALAGAAAVAAAVSAGLDGADVPEATRVARAAAKIGVERGHWVAAADVAARIEWATDLVAGLDPADAGDVIYTLVGTSLATQESVPAAFAALAVHPADAWQAMLLAASLGGDCDTIAAISGAVGGACLGLDSLPGRALDIVRDVNHLDLDVLAQQLLRLRLATPPRRST